MIIGIDGFEANAGCRVGVGQFAYQLILGMYEHLRINPDDVQDTRVYIPGNISSDMPQMKNDWHYIQGQTLPFWTFIGLPFLLMRDRKKPDIMFSPTHYVPRFVSVPRVCSIMDLSYLEYPELFKSKDLYQLTHWTKYSVNHARHIVTISEFTKNAIIEAYHIDRNRISVVYPGLRSMVKQIRSFSEVMDKYQLRIPYILSVGTLQPRKNFIRLIEACALLKHHQKDVPLLVIVGKKGWLYEEILKAPTDFHIEKDVKFLEFVSDDELQALYTHAHFFVLVSLYEGFGLPVLEAMAASCPTVLSNSSSLPEIAGDTAIYVDPNNTESIVQGLLQALKQHGSNEEKKRKEAGFKRIQLFRWDKAAKDTLTILRSVGSNEETL